jgi:hypothetical protein
LSLAESKKYQRKSEYEEEEGGEEMKLKLKDG